jgi:hypothetical protein
MFVAVCVISSLLRVMHFVVRPLLRQ